MRHASLQLNGWQPDALQAFELGLKDGLLPDDVGGKIGWNFGLELSGVEHQRLPKARLKRSEVFSLAADHAVNTATVCAAIMAWGGMNQRFSPKFFALADQGWLEIADQIRAGTLDRLAAYDALARLRYAGKLHGLGPAYFTKIIYFLAPRTAESGSGAYIMDQWAGCSINLLLSEEVVKMDVYRQWQPGAAKPTFDYRVSDANTGTDYLEFCSKVDELREYFGLSEDQVDRAMIASGGKVKSSWREYVVEHRQV